MPVLLGRKGITWTTPKIWNKDLILVDLVVVSARQLWQAKKIKIVIKKKDTT